jgi:glycine/D-amino acid oxidase-like deaminating enzyme
MARAVVIGAGMVGAACAYYLARDGHSVTVVDRGPMAGGTTSRGEGNILVSDKDPGPELDLIMWSSRLWRQLGTDLDAEDMELEAKGGLVVAGDDSALTGLTALATEQAKAGVEVEPVGATRLHACEPHLVGGLAGGAFYPQDQQVQPVRAVAALLRYARRRGAVFRSGTEVTGLRTDSGGAARAVLTDCGEIPADVVVNASGTWGGRVSESFGAAVPVLPRRGFILVTEPMPSVVRHKVYSADYTATVASGDAGLQTSVVVEGTRGGTVLIGASRERVGFDRRVDYDVVRRLAAQALRLFPVFASMRLLRVYRGFRPYCPDHLPVIGPDSRVPGVFHACGHEGAGIGLAPATGATIAAMVAGRTPDVDPSPFSPARFADNRDLR